MSACTARTTSRALATSRSPAANAARVTSKWVSNASARCISATTLAAVEAVSCASHAAVEVAPVSTPTSLRSAPASTRSSSSARRALCRRNASSASPCSAGLNAHTGVAANPSNARPIESVNRSTAARDTPPA